jgi:hypothetical protein
MHECREKERDMHRKESNQCMTVVKRRESCIERSLINA